MVNFWTRLAYKYYMTMNPFFEKKVTMVELVTADYVAIYGYRPSGFGRWSFMFEHKYRVEWQGPESPPFDCDYDKAVQWAVERARQRGSERVRVLPVEEDL